MPNFWALKISIFSIKWYNVHEKQNIRNWMFVFVYSSYQLKLSFPHPVVILTTLETPKSIFCFNNLTSCRMQCNALNIILNSRKTSLVILYSQYYAVGILYYALHLTMARNTQQSETTIKVWPWKLEFGNVGFSGEGKTGVPRETPLGARTRTNNKLNPHLVPSPGINSRQSPHNGGSPAWEANA